MTQEITRGDLPMPKNNIKCPKCKHEFDPTATTFTNAAMCPQGRSKPAIPPPAPHTAATDAEEQAPKKKK